MSKYKTYQVRGTKRYMKDGLLISGDKLSPQVFKILQTADEYDDEVPEVKVSKTCLFCDEPTKLTRTVNLRTIYVCDKHYYSETIGKIAQQIREKELQNA